MAIDMRLAPPDEYQRWKSLLKHRTVRLAGELDDARTTQAIAELLFLQMDDRRKPVSLLIDSQGGSITAGLALTDTIATLDTPVRTHCARSAFGTAALVLAVGRKGLRTASATARIGMGELWMSSESPSPASPEDLQRQQSLFVARLCRVTGRPAARVRGLMDRHEVWLSAAEALVEGFVDEITDGPR